MQIRGVQVMKKKILLIGLYTVLIGCFFAFSGNVEAETDLKATSDGTALDEFMVTESQYNSLYKDNSQYETLRTERYYKYWSRVKETTTSGENTKSGWTKYDTKTSTSTSDYKYGTPIGTTTSYANNKKTVTSAVDKGYYYYAYAVANPSNTSDWTYYVAKTQAAVISHMKQNFSSSATWAEKRLRYFWYISSSDLGSTSKKLNKTIPYCASSSTTVPTTSKTGTHLYDLCMYKYKQCYKVRTDTTINYFYRWSDWTEYADWTPQKRTLPSDGSMKEETELRYWVKAIRHTTALSECDLNVTNSTHFTFDGDEKRLSLELSYDDTTLIEGEDYIIDEYTAINAGTYTVTVLGINDFSGEQNVQFTIEKAKPIISFEKENVTLKQGVQNFDNHLESISDGIVTYTSSDETVVQVSDEGRIETVGKGKATITATVTEGTNYEPGSASYVVTVATSLKECALIVENESFDYDGKEKHAEFSIMDGNTTLNDGIDYEVAGNSGKDAGTYQIIIEGKGEYADQIELQLIIKKRDSVLSFSDNSLVKHVGDAPFINELNSETDGEISFSTADETIAVVDNNGEVSVKGIGTTTITASSNNGKNYKNASVSYSLTVKDAVVLAELDDLRFGFSNSGTDFGYENPYYIPSNIYKMMFGPVLGGSMYYSIRNTKAGAWKGSCAGISATSALLFDTTNKINVKDFNNTVDKIYELSISDKTSSGLSLKQFIEAMQIGQSSSDFQLTTKENKVYANASNLNRFYKTVKAQTDNGIPVVIAISPGGKTGHALLAYRVIENGKTGKVLMYDSNTPNEERSIDLTKDSEGNWKNQWDYDMGSWGIWGPDNSEESWISFVPYGIIQKIWNNRGEKLQKNYNILSTSSTNFRIEDVDGHMVARVKDGVLVDSNSNIIMHQDLTPELSDNIITLTLPIGLYQIHNQDHSEKGLDLMVGNSQVSSSVITTANDATVVASDEYRLNDVYIDADEDDEYVVTLNSSLVGDSEEVVVSGKGNGSTLQISQSNGDINVENCQVLSMSIDGEQSATKPIKARAFGHGSITPEGTEKVVCGSDRIYSINPDKGYQIQDVIVDDESMGGIEKYIFTDVRESHEIIAIFEPVQSYKQIANTISASDIKLFASNKKQTARINAHSEGNVGLSYQSNNRHIDVSKDGVVTVDNNYAGIAAITITSESSDYFKASSKTIKVIVKSKYLSDRIRATNIEMTASNKQRTVAIKASSISRSGFRYTANDKRIKIDKNGNVKIPGNYVGKATISIISKGNLLYQSGKKDIVLIVKPLSVKKFKVKAQNGRKIKITIKGMNKHNGYEIQYATKKSFKNAKTIKVRKTNSKTVILKKLVPKKKYYIRIRSYQKTSKGVISSEWSKVKTVKTKKK